MVFVDGKEVIFHTTFLAKHSHEVLVKSPLGPGSFSLNFKFAQPSSEPAMSWQADASATINVLITPSDSLNSSKAEPMLMGSKADGSPMFFSYTEQAMNGSSLVNFFILKGSAPAGGANS